MLEQHVAHLHVSVNNVQIRQSSNVLYLPNKKKFRQQYVLENEMQFPDANQAVYHVFEFTAEWPEDPTDLSLYKLTLVGSKAIIPRDREVMKLFYGNVDYDTYDINGCKLGLSNGMCVIPNS